MNFRILTRDMIISNMKKLKSWLKEKFFKTSSTEWILLVAVIAMITAKLVDEHRSKKIPLSLPAGTTDLYDTPYEQFKSEDRNKFHYKSTPLR